ncbi:hypothetical protein HYH03_011960 [Edaphochlamys debaryana]|uniref:Group 1 truncated hemoglobin n=1 Tax=Edaphochlamys debaryana TaxID=47281 RepID=A0A836BVX1_9CHLO|nr:hypothetical protein HYH03_011960 [Edaphochlamys debaryana]|eukprot:KAG2489508.1 hypothetical protein HYH03_011960 [Edaphochlamys debaryana]
MQTAFSAPRIAPARAQRTLSSRSSTVARAFHWPGFTFRETQPSQRRSEGLVDEGIKTGGCPFAGLWARLEAPLPGHHEPASAPRSTRSSTKEPQAPALYDKLGGAAAVDAAVGIFYKKIMADPELAPFFAGVDMKRQMKKQAGFLTYAFGGSGAYAGKSLYLSHKRMVEHGGLSERHFDGVAGHLVATLQELGVEQDLIDQVAAIVEPTRGQIFPHTQQ